MHTIEQFHRPLSSTPETECPDCESEVTAVSYQTQFFEHGTGADAVKLSCEVPVHSCRQCGYEWTDEVGEEIRHETVCRHLHRLTPREILSIREAHQLSQAEFSRITGFGEASLSRWETGAQIQNVSNDRLLRLIQIDPVNLRHLREFADRPGDAKLPTFKVIVINEILRERARAFRLRRVG